MWILDALLHSTRGLAKPGMAASVSDEVEQVLSTVRAGNEKAHLSWILQFVDFKGSEFRLKIGTVIEGSRQAVPYRVV